MQVHITLTGDTTPSGLRAIVDEWEADYPKATLYNIGGYAGGKFSMMLNLPPQTQVIQPQLVDMSATSVE